MLWPVLVALLAATAGDTLSDADIAAYEAQPFDQRSPHAAFELGIHHGAKVQVIFPCNGACPSDQLRIVRYEIGSDADCDAIGGLRATEPYAVGYGEDGRHFCVPRLPARFPSSQTAP